MPPSVLNKPPIVLNISDLDMDRAKAEVSVNANNHGGACVHRLFVGGIPKESTEQSMRPLMEQFGTIASINLVPDTMNSALCRGYAFVDYVNPADAQKAINALNGQPYGGYTLKVQHSSQGSRQQTGSAPVVQFGGPIPVLGQVPSLAAPVEVLGGRNASHASTYDAEAALAAALAMTHATSVPSMAAPLLMPVAALPSLQVPSLLPPPLAAPAVTSRVIVLMNMVPLEELDAPDMYAELVQEISEECRKFGTLISTVVPKQGLGRGKVYLQYEQGEHTNTAFRCLKGRKFGPAVVDVTYYSEIKFLKGEYE